jgi:hypothetical protein
MDIPNCRSPLSVEGEQEVISINNLENKLNKEGANPDEIAEAFSVREQTMFRNMQLLSLSVQPDDAPERLFGTQSQQIIAPQTNAADGPPQIGSPANVHTPRDQPRILRPTVQEPPKMPSFPAGPKVDRLSTRQRM